MSKKVLMFGWEFPPYNSGGLGIACLGLTKALIDQGVDVQFVLPKKFDLDYPHINFLFADTRTEINQENFYFYKKLLNAYSILETEDKLLREVAFDLNLEEPSGTIYDQVLQYTINSEKIINDTNFDIIHTHDWLTIESGILAKKIKNKPLFFHIHATEIDRTGGHVNQLIYDIERKGMHFADKIIAVSDYTKSTIIKHYGIESNKIEVVHNGIDYYTHKNASLDYQVADNLYTFKKLGRKIVIFVGRLTMQKGIQYFLESARLAVQKDSELLFLIIGSGDMEEKLIEQTASMGLSSNVIFTGFLRDEKLKAVYTMADLFVMPSVNEPFGLVALEAVVHNTPVIVSKTSGVSEGLTHSLAVDFWDTHTMANMILAITNHPALSQAIVQNSEAELQNINWENSAGRVVEVYKSV
jgi:glycosyltransferase involved in cell wall biosynthesis